MFDGFNKAHTLSYSIVGLIELNLNYKYDPIYWQTANLIVESGAADESANDQTDYGKLGIAIAMVQAEDVHVTPPLINEAGFGFKPDTATHRILFGLKGINGVNTELAQAIIQNRPYTSIEDFTTRMYETKIVKPSQMIQLIKARCFTELHSPDCTKTMDWFIRKYLFKPTETLTLQQFNKVKELGLIPEQYELTSRMVNYKKYVLDDVGLYEKHIEPGKKLPKRGYHDGYYILDEAAQSFFQENFTEDSVVKVVNGFYVVSEKLFTKEVDKYIQPFKDWMLSQEALDAYNQAIFNELWQKYASGTLSSWSMQALTYYDGQHELENIDEELYGIANFYELPEEPMPYEYYYRYINGERKKMAKYHICRIAGTVLQADSNHHTVALLTKYGLVNVKFNKGHYAFYDKRISARLDPNSDKKTVLEDSWLKRGRLLAICGIRRDDQFWPLIYQDTIYKHTVQLIKEIRDDGTLLFQMERVKIDG